MRSHTAAGALSEAEIHKKKNNKVRGCHDLVKMNGKQLTCVFGIFIVFCSGILGLDCALQSVPFALFSGYLGSEEPCMRSSPVPGSREERFRPPAFPC